MSPENRPAKWARTRMRALTAWGGASNLVQGLKDQVLRAAGALRALAGRLRPQRALSAEELEALDRLVRAQRAKARAESLRRDVEQLRAVLAGELPVPEGVLLEVGGQVYPPGSWIRRTLRVIQGGR